MESQVEVVVGSGSIWKDLLPSDMVQSNDKTHKRPFILFYFCHFPSLLKIFLSRGKEREAQRQVSRRSSVGTGEKRQTTNSQVCFLFICFFFFFFK